MDSDQVLEELHGLQDFLLDFRNVERVTPIPGTDCTKRENDVEHSYFLALACWYVTDKLRLLFDHEKLLKYALVHDLPEAYAGDVDAFASAAKREEKALRETEATRAIQHRFQKSFPGMVEYLEAYEAQAEQESRFVKALDKLMPAIMITMDEGGSWQEQGITQHQLIENKLQTTGICEPVYDICCSLMEFLKQHPEYFAAEQRAEDHGESA